VAFRRKFGGGVKHLDVTPVKPNLITCLERGRCALSPFPALLRFDHRGLCLAACFSYLV
jgi:hypothetical protein